MEARLLAVGARCDELADRSMTLWLGAGLDPLGGAHGFLDRALRPVTMDDDARRGPSDEVIGDQSLVQQARHLYAYSLYAEHRPQSLLARERARALHAHLSGAFEEGDAFVHARARDGRVRSRSVQLYAQGFGVFALSTYARTMADPSANERALSHFLALDSVLHDTRFGGYDQRADGGWLAFVSAPPGAAKCANTHLHSLETLTALVRSTQKSHALFPLVFERTLELARLMATQLCRPSGYLHPFFDEAWQPLGPPRVSYGHDVEASWLLLDALDALTAQGDVPRPLVEPLEEAAVRLLEHALRTGWDPEGGLFEHGIPEGQAAPPEVLGRDKIWWAQAELLPALYRSYRLTGDVTLVTRLERTLAFLSEKSWDRDCGGYFWGVDARGEPTARGDHKGELWKTPYHDVRACLLTAHWIADDLGEGTGS